MQPIDATATRYDRTTMLFHWLTAGLVAVQWLGAQVIDWFPRGPLRVDARSVHIVGGVLLGLVLIARLVWRLTSGRRLPPDESGPLRWLARGTHWSLYALLTFMVLLGVLLTWVRGDSIFGLFSIPAFASGDRALVRTMEWRHNTVGYVILAVAGLHAAAALFHRLVWHDGVLSRMLPGSRGG